MVLKLLILSGISFKRFIPLFDEDNDFDSNEFVILTDDDEVHYLVTHQIIVKISCSIKIKIRSFCS